MDTQALVAMVGDGQAIARMGIVSVEYRALYDGKQVEVTFANGWGASIIHHSRSYGVELAVLDRRGNLSYDTPVTNDVLGGLTPETLREALREIDALPEAP